MTERGLFSVDASAQGGPYSPDQMRLYLQAIIGDDDGVLRGELNEYVVTISGSDLRTASGRGAVNGTQVESDANIDKTPAVPAIGTTGLRIVLQKIWNTATDIETHVELLEAADGTATPPVVTQTDGTKWEISLATAEITTGGVIQTLVDTRPLISPAKYPHPIDIFRQYTENGRDSGFFWLGPAANGVTFADDDLVGLGCSVSEAGTGAVTPATATDESGMWGLTTGATNSGDAGHRGPRALSAEDPTIVWRGRIDTLGVNASVLIGFINNSTDFEDSNDIIAVRVLAGGTLQGVCDESGSETTRDFSFTPDGTEHTIAIEVLENATIVRFYFDGVQQGADVTTDITATSTRTGAGISNGATSAARTMQTADFGGTVRKAA